MHVLGHSFSQKCRRSKRPRDLHIRKVSFSGSSLSGCSLSSSDSTASAVTAIITPTQHTAGSSSGSIPPRRLHERAFKVSHSPQRPQFTTRSSKLGGTFYHDDDDDDDAEEAVEEDEEYSGDEDDENLPRFEMQMPPHASRDDEHTGHDRHEPRDYFAFALARRPTMPRSRWSESTIQSVQSIDALPTPGSTISTAASEQGEDHSPPVKVEMPPNMNFSYKRVVSTPGATVSPSASGSGYRRPPMKTMDSIDEFVKRGGWKRRGVVFRQDEVEAGQDAGLCL